MLGARVKVFVTPDCCVHRSLSQALRLVGGMSHGFVLVVLPCFPFGSHVVTHLTVVSALFCQCSDS